MRAMLFDSSVEGHHMQHIGALAPALAELLDRLTICLAEDAFTARSFALHIKPFLSDKVRFDTFAPPEGTPNQKSDRRAQLLRSAIEKHRPEHVYLPSADGLLQHAAIQALLGRLVWPKALPVEALMLSGKAAYDHIPLDQRLLARFSYLAARKASVARLHHLDPFCVERANTGRLSGGPLWLMPEPVEDPLAIDKAEARRRLGLPINARIVGTGGTLDHRKGADLLLDAWLRVKHQPDDVLFLIGPVKPIVMERINGSCRSLVESGRIILREGYVTDEELLTGLAALDLVVVAYRLTTLSSGIATRAMAQGRPLLGANTGWIRRMIDRFDAGYHCNVEDIDELAGTIEQSLPKCVDFVQSDIARRLTRFHSIANFLAHWTSLIRQRLGKPQDPNLLSWEWVNQI